jgi:hypothetical protein
MAKGSSTTSFGGSGATPKSAMDNWLPKNDYATVEDFFNSDEFQNMPEFAKPAFKEAFQNAQKQQDIGNAAQKLADDAAAANAAVLAALEKAEKARIEAENRRLAKEEEDTRAAQEYAANVKRELTAQSDRFEGEKAGLGQSIAAIGGEQTREELGESLKDVEQAANRRGLLFSGMKEKAQQGLRDEASANLMAQQQAINADLDAQSQAYKKMASEGVNANQDLIFSNMAQQRENAATNYAQGLQARRAKLQGRSGVRSLMTGAQKVKDDIRDAQEGLQPSNFAPQVFGTLGNVAGQGITAYYNKNNKGTT